MPQIVGNIHVIDRVQFRRVDTELRDAVARALHDGGGAPRDVVEERKHRLAHADQHIAAVGCRYEYRRMGMQCVGGMAQLPGIEGRRIGADQQRARVVQQGAFESAVHALAEIAAALHGQADAMLRCRLAEFRVGGVGGAAEFDRADLRGNGALEGIVKHAGREAGGGLVADGLGEAGFYLAGDGGFGEDDDGAVLLGHFHEFI